MTNTKRVLTKNYTFQSGWGLASSKNIITLNTVLQKYYENSENRIY